jgi:hypothetical protein
MDYADAFLICPRLQTIGSPPDEAYEIRIDGGHALRLSCGSAQRRLPRRERADGEDAVMYAEAAHVVATLMEDAVDKLDPVHLRLVTEEAERDGTAEPTL